MSCNNADCMTNALMSGPALMAKSFFSMLILSHSIPTHRKGFMARSAVTCSTTGSNGLNNIIVFTILKSKNRAIRKQVYNKVSDNLKGTFQFI